MPLACFAKYLETRSSSDSISVVEAAHLTEVAKNLTIARAPEKVEEPAIDRFENAVSFLSLLSGIYVLSGQYKSLVPALSAKSTPEEKYEIEQLQGIEKETANKLRLSMKERLGQLAKDSKAEIMKINDSPKRKELILRLDEILKIASN